MKNCTCFSYFGFKLTISYQIASLFDMYIDMGERIAGKQDRPSLVIEDPLRAPQIAQNMHCFSNGFPLLYIGFHCGELCIC